MYFQRNLRSTNWRPHTWLMIYYCLLFIFHYLQDLVLQRAICILGHTHDQKIYYTSMSEPCADYLGEHNIHYIITRDLFFFTFSLDSVIFNHFIDLPLHCAVCCCLRNRWFCPFAYLQWLVLLCSHLVSSVQNSMNCIKYLSWNLPNKNW